MPRLLPLAPSLPTVSLYPPRHPPPFSPLSCVTYCAMCHIDSFSDRVEDNKCAYVYRPEITLYHTEPWKNILSNIKKTYLFTILMLLRVGRMPLEEYIM